MAEATTMRKKRAGKKVAVPRPATARLRSGVDVRIRPIRPTDEPRLRQGLAHFSPQSRYQRFLVPDFHPSPENFRYLAHPDFQAHLCLVMETIPARREEEPRGVGVARCIRTTELGPDIAEFAVAVADEYQAQGAGKELLRALAKWAYRTGVRRWYGLMLADNEAVVHATSAVADLVERKCVEPGVVECTFALRDPDAHESVH